MKNFKRSIEIIVVLSFAILLASAGAYAGEPDNTDALAGFRSARAVFDVNVGKPQQLSVYLTVIDQTHAELTRQGLVPDFVVTLRGPAVKLVSSETTGFDESQREVLSRIPDQIAELRKKGVRFEGCAVAAAALGVDTQKILSSVKVVGNTFISLIGYQQQGYAIVPIM